MLTKTYAVADYVADLLVALNSTEGVRGSPYYVGAPLNSVTGQYQNVTIATGINIDWGNSNSLNLKLVLVETGLVAACDAAEVARRANATPHEPPETSAERSARMVNGVRVDLFR